METIVCFLAKIPSFLTIFIKYWPKCICDFGFIINHSISQENTCVRVSFLVKLQASGVFMWILRISKGTFDYRIPLWILSFPKRNTIERKEIPLERRNIWKIRRVFENHGMIKLVILPSCLKPIPNRVNVFNFTN